MRRAQLQQVFPAGPESQPLYGVSKFLMLLNKHKILLPEWSRTVLPPPAAVTFWSATQIRPVLQR